MLPVTLQPPLLQDSLASGPVLVPWESEVVVKSYKVRNDGNVAYYASRTLWAENAAGDNITWELRVDGVRITARNLDTRRNTTDGQLGAPRDVVVAKELKPGQTFQVVAINAAADPSDGTSGYTVETDGYVNYYDRPLPVR